MKLESWALLDLAERVTEQDDFLCSNGVPQEELPAVHRFIERYQNSSTSAALNSNSGFDAGSGNQATGPMSVGIPQDVLASTSMLG